jgi:hypothetical protein
MILQYLRQTGYCEINLRDKKKFILKDSIKANYINMEGVKMRQRHFLAILAIVSGWVGLVMGAHVSVVNPSGLDTNVNTLGETMEEVVGNYSIAQFNANVKTYNHTFEPSDGYNSGDHILSVILTSPVSGIDLVATYILGGASGFGNVISAWVPTGGSSAACWASAGTHSVTFDNAVQGVGFTINRCYLTITIELFDEFGSQIGSTYTVTDNTSGGGSAHSFFGYYDENAAIARVEFTAPATNQFAIDDFTVIVGLSDPDDFISPTPDPMIWYDEPEAIDSSRITMTAVAASDAGGVEYYFEETSGNPGGSDSGWQDSRVYIDSELNSETEYTYRVRARDKSPNQNAASWSTSVSETTASWSITPTSDLPDVSGVTGADIDESNISYTLHVSVDGIDTNPGTLALPFRTVNKAAQVAAVHQGNNDGVKVIIHPGTYREYVDALMAGYDTPDGVSAPMIFEASEPGTAILSASEIYAGWARQGSSDIYTHSWTHDWGLFMVPDWTALAGYRVDKFLNNPILRRIEMFFADGERLTQVLTYDHYVPHDDPGVTELENSFYIDEAADLVYIHLPAGSDISQMTIESAERHYVFGTTYINNLVIRGLVFQHAANTLSIQTAPSGGGNGALYIESGVNVLLEDNLFHWNNGAGYTFYGDWEEPTGTYRVYYPCEEITARRNSSNYNGFSGFECNVARNWIYEDNEESYNNWRGAQGSWNYDNSGRGLGLYSGWTGTRFYRMHFAIIRRHKAIGNYARGIWFDYDNMHILYEDGLLHDNMTGLKFEVDPGPIWIKDTVITDNGIAGILVSIADHTTIENCVITGNAHLTSIPWWHEAGQAQIRMVGGEHYVGVWDGLISAYFMDMENWTMFDTVIGGSSPHPLMKVRLTTGLTNFLNNQASEHNYWYHTASTDVFEIGTDTSSTMYDFAGWKTQTGQDSSSVFASSAPVPSFCGDFGTTYPVVDVDDNCRTDFVDFARIARIWDDASVCDDPLFASYEDLYHDCQIDIRDIAVLANHWLEDTNP